MSQPAIRSRRILLVEDDQDLCSLMRDYLTQHGFTVEVALDGRLGLTRALEEKFDLILLDVMLPSLDGIRVLCQLRKRDSTPVIILTARTSPADRIAGLEFGADDYLSKPFDPEELLARMRAVLRRVGKADAPRTEIEAGALRLNLQTREACYHGTLLDVTSLEFDLLELLVSAAGRTVSRDVITAAIHQRKSTPYERSLDVHISHLRKKLEYNQRTPIQTVRGVGYQFAPLVDEP
ncbi:MAG: response regulator transcription factor [Candidatus Solibacter sp.]